ncbi:MAG: formylglycine-generating enzyme family protein [Deltaproteobacteria bacterium HGW-Deltaproteobacteria-3]|nr:MAG: formylglycine-generating enzyme family protein [Deltaproteobacteria bacterium HGW-Deltaproteobacteria-3]
MRKCFLLSLALLLVAAPCFAGQPEGARDNTVSILPDIEFVAIPGGCFRRGDTKADGYAFDDEKPAHQVCLEAFSIGKHEVTQGQWQLVMDENPSANKKCGGNCPVEQVSWDDAQVFITRLNTLTGRNYRLPTEAEWEYAARGGQGQTWAGTDNRFELQEYARFAENSVRQSGPVGEKKPNPFGLYDMTGNVWEWVQDWYGAHYYAASPCRNPQGPQTGEHRVFRGGSWGTNHVGARASNRLRREPGFRSDVLGFRLVLPFEVSREASACD